MFDFSLVTFELDIGLLGEVHRMSDVNKPRVEIGTMLTLRASSSRFIEKNEYLSSHTEQNKGEKDTFNLLNTLHHMLPLQGLRDYHVHRWVALLS